MRRDHAGTAFERLPQHGASSVQPRLGRLDAEFGKSRSLGYIKVFHHSQNKDRSMGLGQTVDGIFEDRS